MYKKVNTVTDSMKRDWSICPRDFPPPCPPYVVEQSSQSEEPM